MGTLGAGSNEAVIYARGGQQRLFTVPAVASLEWGRNLDAVSRAVVSATPAASGDTWESCCDLLSTVHPWGMETVIWRDGERVWEGPVRRVVQNRAGVTILASDVLGWMEKAPTTGRATTLASVRDEGAAAVTAAFTYVGDPDVLDHLTTLGSDTVLTDLEVKTATGHWLGVMDELAKSGLYFTVIGRRIVLWADPTLVLGMTSVLNPALHLMGDVETAREGDELATEAWGANDDGLFAIEGGTDDFYGRVARVVPLPNVTSEAGLLAAITEWRKSRDPAPESLTLPSGSTLTCDAPFTIAELVPGVLTPVKVSDLCWPVEQSMMLTGVKVTQDADGEKVGVTYAPITGDETPGPGE